MQAAENPSGLLSVPPVAIADIADVDRLRGDDAPIDAIRVRVAGIGSTYDDAARAKVERVASRIAAMDLSVDIVAGSSPQDVSISVPDYYVWPGSGHPDGASLGDIRQGWSTIGAAQHVEHGLSSTTTALLLIALAAAAVAVVGTETARRASRAREMALLRALGWRRGRIVRWLLAESVTAAAMVAAGTVAVWAATGASAIGLWAGLGVAGFVVLTAAAGLGWLLRPSRGASASLVAVRVGDVAMGPWVTAAVPHASSPARYGVRAALGRPVRAAAIAAVWGLAAATMALGAATLAEAAAGAGPTELGSALAGVLRPYQGALLAATGVAGVAMTVLLTRRDVVDRRTEWRALAAIGWTPRAIGRARRAQRTVIAAVAAVLAGVVAGAGAAPVAAAEPLTPVALAVCLALTISIWGGLVRSRREMQ